MKLIAKACWIYLLGYAAASQIGCAGGDLDALNDTYARYGVHVIRSVDPSSGNAGAKQRFYDMQVDLSVQQENKLLKPTKLSTRVERPIKTNMTIVSDDFEDAHWDDHWHRLSAGDAAFWGPSPAQAFSGLTSLWCAVDKYGLTARDGRYPDNALTWIISGPYDLKDAENVRLSFYTRMESELDHDFLFWGASTDGKLFKGRAVTGDSQGWQLVSHRLDDMRVPDGDARRKVWFGLMFISDSSGAGAGVYIDRLSVTRDQGWHQQFAARVNGIELGQAYSGGIGLARPAYTDIDNDGDLDLFVGEYDGTLNFYRNDGTANAPKWSFVDSKYAGIDVGENSAPAFVDINGDGDQDLFIGDGAGLIHVYRNRGTAAKAEWRFVGHLSDADNQTIDVQGVCVPQFCDIDADGDADLLLGTASGGLLFYRNESNKQAILFRLMQRPLIREKTGTITAPALADIDGDGDLDLFMGNNENKLMFWRNTGSARKPRYKLITRAFAKIAVGDVTTPVFADLDNDNSLDLTVADAEGILHFFVNTGDEEAWQPTGELDSQTLDVGFQSSPELNDLDSDGDLDLVLGASDGTLHFYENTGDAGHAVWQYRENYFEGIDVHNWSTPTFVDIDADGDLDLFSGTNFGRLVFFRNDGDVRKAAWRLVTEFYDSLRFESQTLFPTFADIDADGDYDLFVSTNVRGTSYFENTGTAVEAQWQLRSSNFLNSKSVVRVTPIFVDMDGDGDLDVLSGNHSGTIQFYENVGSREHGHWRLLTADYLQFKIRLSSTPAVGDMDGDGDLDLFMGTNSGGLYFWKNMSSEPSFVLPVSVNHQ